MNLLDSMIAALVPELALKRERSRFAAARLRNAADSITAYEAGGVGRRYGGLKDRPTSANTEILRSLARMRNRHRTLVRDNPWAAAAIRAIVTNAIGYGITSEVFNGVDPDKALTDLWLRWAESTDCDSAGMNNFYGLQAMAMQSVCEAGEVLIRRRWRRPEDLLPVPFQLEMLEPDYLDHSNNQNLPNGGRVVQGVEFDAIGKRVGYWLFKDHPGDSLARVSKSSRVAAEDVAHIYRADRPQQVRGVPWGHAAMLTLYDLDGFEDAFLLRQKLANCFMGIERETEPSMNQTTDDADALDDLEPGIVYRPKPGREMTFSNPPIAAEYGGYVDRVLYRVAAAYGISYQALTGNLEKVNFSSGRMGWLDFQRNIERWRWNMIIPQGCERVAKWFLEAAVLTGAKVSRETRFEWTPPRREMIDPAKEVPPLRDAIRAGLTSLPAIHREYGEHTDRILAEIADTNKQLDEMGIVLDSDPRKVNKAGLSQPDTSNTPTQN